jgi:hypothetical protein
MFIGIVSINKDFVEQVQIDAQTDDEAQTVMASYVYNSYNKQVPIGGYFYNGVVINTKNLKTITATKELAAC